MTSRNAFDAFAAARGEGLHPKLRELFDRTAARTFSELAVRGDGMLQAGPDPSVGRAGRAIERHDFRGSGDKDTFSCSVHSGK
jgi:hypothetical protein